jgi:hypothetical protein
MTPRQNHTAMEFSSGAGAIRLAAFTRQFIDVAFDHRRSSENNIQRLFKICQMLMKGLAQATELVWLLFSLHVLYIYYIQNMEKQVNNRKPTRKCMGGSGGDPSWGGTTAAGFYCLKCSGPPCTSDSGEGHFRQMTGPACFPGYRIYFEGEGGFFAESLPTGHRDMDDSRRHLDEGQRLYGYSVQMPCRICCQR